MSHALYTTRLYWAGGRGIAKLHGREVRLTAPPHLPGMEIEAVDYTPEVRCAMVMPRRGGWREMTSDEIHEADQLLAEITKEVRDAPAA
jgi:hypothetical protein